MGGEFSERYYLIHPPAAWSPSDATATTTAACVRALIQPNDEHQKTILLKTFSLSRSISL